MSERYFKLLLDYSEFMRNKGLFAEAALLLERIVFVNESEGTQNSKNMADIYKILGDIYRESDLDKAIDSYKKRYEILNFT